MEKRRPLLSQWEREWLMQMTDYSGFDKNPREIKGRRKEMLRMYLDRTMSASEISRRFGVSGPTGRRLMESALDRTVRAINSKCWYLDDEERLSEHLDCL